MAIELAKALKALREVFEKGGCSNWKAWEQFSWIFEESDLHKAFDALHNAILTMQHVRPADTPAREELLVQLHELLIVYNLLLQAIEAERRDRGQVVELAEEDLEWIKERMESCVFNDYSDYLLDFLIDRIAKGGEPILPHPYLTFRFLEEQPTNRVLLPRANYF